MRRRRAILDPTNVQGCVIKVGLLPTKIDKLRGAEPVPESNQDHRRVPVALLIVLGGLDEALDLCRRQVLTGPQLPVRRTSGWASLRNCALLKSRADDFQARSHEEILRFRRIVVRILIEERTEVSRPFQHAKRRLLRAILRADFALFAFQFWPESASEIEARSRFSR
jgi:hypothetical protein